MSNRTQRVGLNSHSSTWEKVDAGVPQGDILDQLLFLIRINDLYDGLLSNVKLFPDETSIFLITHETNGSASELNTELKKINDLTFQEKVSLNPHHSNQA